MIIVRLKVRPRTEQTEKFWKEKARGVIDEFGNPFRIIKLRWIWSRTNLCTSYQKTFGFDDAILKKDPNSGGIAIKYRNGSLMWMRPAGGVGDYESDCPLTPNNIKRLIATYPNRTWHIVDDDIRAQVKAGWEKKQSKMDDKTRKKNKKWFRSMHTAALDAHEPGSEEAAQIALDTIEIVEKQKDLAVKEQDIAQREAKVADTEQAVIDDGAERVLKGEDPVAYSEVYLKSQKFGVVRNIAKKAGIVAAVTDTKEDVIGKILDLSKPKGLGD